MMRRAMTSVVASRHALTAARRTTAHQEKQTGQDDLTWAEGDAVMTAETRYALLKQRELLQAQAAQINAQYEAEHEKTRDAMNEHHEKSSKRIAELEEKIAEMKALLESLQKKQ
eukprot:TRINITY_DN48_c0_g1_i2.p3 TRINITY_DN48_c0_g1~~TRINITY_DN48_c0_g1_i2.p3  ORF type:complete len:114 (+),score=62.55 TRINITY_DN48_c0_g1_i2:52-393(+)